MRATEKILQSRKSYRRGAIVRIVKLNDDSSDQEDLEPFVGKAAVVVRVHKRPDGNGGTRKDPFVLVSLSSGQTNGFWSEELELLREGPNPTRKDRYRATIARKHVRRWSEEMALIREARGLPRPAGWTHG